MDTADNTLTQMLDALDAAADQPDLTVGDVLDQFGTRSFAPVILMISLVLISPVSGIPGVPTLSACVIVLIAGQALIGRSRLWLPGILLRRRVTPERLRSATGWLRKPCAWIDRNSHPRLRILTSGPMRPLTLLACVCVPLVWPVLELVPFVTSTGALSVALMTFGLLTRDGVYAAAGYGVAGGMAALILWLV